jgi:pteridine reductase
LAARSYHEVAPPNGETEVINANKPTSRRENARPLALITGAAQRLGAVMARYLHAHGYDVALHYYSSQSQARTLAKELNATRAASAFILRQDLASPLAGERLIKALTRKAKRLDLLVNNASIFEPSPLALGNAESWESIQAINVRTPYFLSLAAAPLLRRRHGSIVNIADIHANRPRRDYAMYCVSKAGLEAVSRSLALELAPDVRVNCISPGAILWAASEDAEVQLGTVAAIPMGRCGEPLDIAEAVLYLASANYVSGHVINVDGGRVLRC